MPTRPPQHHPPHWRSPEQRKQAADERRGNATDRGYDHRWKKARLMWLRKNPLCVHCEREGRLTEATVVDHIKDHKGNERLFWNQDNWQSLCKHHHDVKTALESGFGKHG